MDIKKVGRSPEDIGLELRQAFLELDILVAIAGTAAGQGNFVKVDNSVGVDSSAGVDKVQAFTIQDSRAWVD
jgi:hypothetical protein